MGGSGGTSGGTPRPTQPNVGTLQVHQTSALYGSAFVGDFDGDQDQDVVVVGSTSIIYLLRNGNGRLGAPEAIQVPTGAPGIGFAARSFTLRLPGRRDPVLVVWSGSNLWVWSGFAAPGGGTFRSIPGAPQGDNGAVGDLNGDGGDELVLGTRQSVQVVSLDGSGALKDRFDAAIGDEVRKIVVADHDGDGRNDAIVLTNRGSLKFLNGDGVGRFRGAQQLDVCKQASTFASADFDGDKRFDHAVACDNQLLIFYGVDASSFLERSFSFQVSTLLGRDLEGDGVAELVLGSPGRLTTLRAPQTGGLTIIQEVRAPATPFVEATADLDGDGSQEVIAVGRATSQGSGEITTVGVLLGLQK
jgi:hypothetical protein